MFSPSPSLRRACAGLLVLASVAVSWFVAPTVAMADETLPALLSDVTTAAGYRYGTRDTAGRSLDCLEIQQVAPGQYLGVSHTDEGGIFNVYLHSSTDLLHWTPVRRLDSNASQPTLEPDGHGGWLFADEVTRSIGGNYLRLRHYASTDALMSGMHDRQFEPPNTLAGPGGAQGTPNFFDVSLDPDIDHSVIQLGFHYYDGRDLQATATLTNFSGWSAQARPDLDAKFATASGNVGDRDFFTHEGHSYGIHEAQFTAGSWGSWRVWLRDRTDDSVAQLNMRTHAGSIAFGNPTVTMLTLPDGRPGFVETNFVFSEGAARGEGGELVFYKALPPPSPPADAPPTAALTVTPSTGAAPLDVTADASGSTDGDDTGIDTYTFDFGDGSPVVGPQIAATATHAYGSAGTYSVTVTVTDTAGLSSTATSTVSVGDPAPPPTTAPPTTAPPTPTPDQPPAASVTVAPSAGVAVDSQPPTPPSSLTASPVSPSRVDLAWTESTDDVGVTGYLIYRAPTGSTSFAAIDTATVATASDTSAAPGVGYDYAVTAVDAQTNASASSNIATVTTPPFTATFGATADATVKKSKSGTNYGTETKMVIDNSPVDDALIRFDVVASGCTRVTNAMLRLTDNGDSSDWGGDFYTTAPGWIETSVNWSNAPPRGTLIGSLGRVTSGATYPVDVTAGVTAPNGPVSFRIGTTSNDRVRYYSKEGGTAAQRPQLSVTCVGGTVTDTIAPTAPTTLTATPMSSNRIDLSWTASTDDVGVTGYAIYRAPTGATAFAKVGATSGATAFSDTSVVPSTGYDYRVTALDAATHESAISNTSTATTASTGGLTRRSRSAPPRTP